MTLIRDLKKSIDDMNERMDKRFDHMDKRFDHIDREFVEIKDKLDALINARKKRKMEGKDSNGNLSSSPDYAG